MLFEKSTDIETLRKNLSKQLKEAQNANKDLTADVKELQRKISGL